MPTGTHAPGFLAGRTALVTGGASGIGRAIVMALAEAGANVAIGSLVGARGATALAPGEAIHIPQDDALEQTRAALARTGVGALALPLDVASAASVAGVVERTVAAFGAIDILVNAAGTNATRAIVDETEETWERVMQVNLAGQFRTIKACMPGMIRRRWGRIVNVSSTAGLEGHARHAAYCASKAGVIGLTRCVALEGAAHGINCNALCPGWVRTPGCLEYVAADLAARGDQGTTVHAYLDRLAAHDIPIGRLMAPEEPASLVVYLCSDMAAALTGEALRMAGGVRW